MTDEDDGDPVPLGEVHQPQGRLADLADAAGRPVELVDRGGLDRIDDHRERSLAAGCLDDPPDVVFGEDADTVRRRPAQQAEPRRPKADLPGRLLARRIQHGPAARRPGHPGGGLEQERGLADPRFAADQHERPRDQSAAEDAIEFVDADAQARQVGVGDRREAHRLRAGTDRDPAGGSLAARRFVDDRLDEAVPLAAGRALALPSAGTTPRRTGRRSGSSAAPSLGRQVGGADHRASTGVRGSAARWMSRPASGSLSTTIVDPGSYEPSSSCSARTSSIMFWMTRRSGRAP